MEHSNTPGNMEELMRRGNEAGVLIKLLNFLDLDVPPSKHIDAAMAVEGNRGTQQLHPDKRLKGCR